MKSVFFLALTLTLANSAWARKPAVEDFVGIENSTQDVTPPGTQALFNFEQEVKAYEGRAANKAEAVIVHQKTTTTSGSQTAWPWTTWAGIFLVLGLPVGTWALTMRHLKSRQTATVATVVPLPTRAKKTDHDDIKKSA